MLIALLYMYLHSLLFFFWTFSLVFWVFKCENIYNTRMISYLGYGFSIIKFSSLSFCGVSLVREMRTVIASDGFVWFQDYRMLILCSVRGFRCCLLELVQCWYYLLFKCLGEFTSEMFQANYFIAYVNFL